MDELAGRRQRRAGFTDEDPGPAADRDDATGALKHQPGREQMQVLLDRARREGSLLTFMYVDVDDSRAADRGDRLLAAVTSALLSNLGADDLVVRYGSDAFVCALPGRSEEGARAGLADVRAVLDRLALGAAVSAGFAELAPTDTLDEAIHRAVTDLYQHRWSEHPSAWRRPAPAVLRGERRPSVACGGCGGRVPLAEFVLEVTTRMIRSADCPECGVTTVIQLADAPTQPLLPPEPPER